MLLCNEQASGAHEMDGSVCSCRAGAAEQAELSCLGREIAAGIGIPLYSYRSDARS